MQVFSALRRRYEGKGSERRPRHFGVVSAAAALCALWLCLPCQAQSGRLQFDHLSVEDGLSNEWVQSIVKDSRGFLWFGTQDGLNRYDGGGIRIYRHDPQDPNSLPSSVIQALLEDSKERLWIGSGWGSSGVSLYDRDRDCFKRFSPNPGQPVGNDVYALFEDRRGQLWLGTDNGIVRFDPEKGAFKRFPLVPESSVRVAKGMISCFFEDRRGRLWVTTRAGLLQFDRERGEYTRWEGPSELAGLTRAQVWDIYEDAEGGLWVATLGEGLYRLDPSTKQGTRYLPDPRDPASISHARVRRLVAAGDDTLYVGTENGGLSILDLRTRKFRHESLNPDDETSLSSASIWSMYRDDQGILWLGTYNGGVDYVSPLGQRFQRLRARSGGLSDAHVGSVMEDHLGNLWIGTDGGGLNKLDRRTGTFTCYRHDPRNRATLGSDAVFALFEDDSGAIWLGGWDSGLCRLDPASGRVTRFRHDPKDPTSIVNDNIWRILQLRTGELLVTTHFGADLLDRRTGVFTHLSEHDMGATEPLFSAAEDKEGNLWLVGGTFVARIDRRTGRTQRYRNDPQDPKSLGAGWTQAVRIDSAENVWLGTEGGLSCVVAGTREMRRYTTADGLPNNNITGILEDGSGNLWLATNRGLSEFVGAVKLTDRPTFLNFDVHDGLQGYEFARNAACRGKDGEMFFGGSRGLSFFYPERIQRNPHVPPVVLTDLKIFNRSAGIGAPGSPLARAITQTEALTLSYRHSMVTFEFAALNFIIPQKNQYAYRLEGFDSTWNYVGVQRSATYTSLPPGRYTLRVKAANNDGVWNEAGTTLALTVVPPFHRAVWFRLLVLLTATAALAFAYRRHTARMQSHARELAAKVEERTRDLNHLNVELANLNQQLEERVRARTAEVEEEKERLTVTLRSIGDGVIATDVEGRVVLLNRVAEQITGWAPGEAYDRTLGEVMPLVDRRTREPLPDPASLVLERGVVLDLPATAMLVRRDGGEVLIADSAAPICDRQSRIVGVVLVFRDVTERRKVEEELQNAQKLESLGVLAGGIAHDFNNLLTGIFGLVDLARHRSAADAPARGPLERVLAVLDRARGLTGQLLTFSQHGQPVTGPVALSPLLKNCVEFALSGSNVSCSLEMTDDVWPCDGDERQIHQVVDNLLLNARQAMPRGGTVEVQAANVKVPEDVQIPGAPGRYVRITVRDHGEGVPPELRSRIFEPFFTTKPTGSGLGLATSYSIIRKHGGHIEVSSGPGEGAAFVVYLPAASRTPASPAKRETEIPKGLGRILIVDDEDYVREVASELLGELGYTVELAADGDAAVEVCRRAVAEGRPFDAAILDLTIPGGLGGVAAAPLLRRVDSRLPLIASSGYSGDPVMAHPQAYGFAATLNKPFTLEELGTLMARVLKPE